MLFSALFVLLFIAVIFLGKYLFHSFRNSITYFCGLWALTMFFADLGEFFGYYPVSCEVNVSALVMIITFCFCMCLKHENINIINDNKPRCLGFNVKLFIFVNAICIIFVLPMLVSSIDLIINNGYAWLRANYTDKNVGISNSGVCIAVMDNIARPVFYTTITCTAVAIFSDIKRKLKVILGVFCVLEMLILCIMTAARGSVVSLLTQIMICFIVFYGKNLKNYIVFFRKQLVMIFLLLFAVIIMSIFRHDGGDFNFIEQMYLYRFGGPIYLSELLKIDNGYGIWGGLLWGQATFGFITNIFSDLMMVMTGNHYGSQFLIGSVLTSGNLTIGDQVYANALFTAIYAFILDWGWTGVFFGGIIIYSFNYIITSLVMRNKNNYFGYCLLISWYNIIINTTFRWELFTTEFSLVLLLLLLYSRKFIIR